MKNKINHSCVDLIYLLSGPMGRTIREDKIENDKRKAVDMKKKNE